MSEADALAALSARAGQAAANDRFSGTLLVAGNGKVLLDKPWSLADRAARKANTPETQFRLGSMNKMFTAIATLQLVEAGKLALDDAIRKRLPSCCARRREWCVREDRGKTSVARSKLTPYLEKLACAFAGSQSNS